MCLLFAILALLSGIMGTIFLGIIGFAVTAVFAILAIIFASKKRKSEEGGGTGSMVVSIISLVLGLLITLFFIGMAKVVKDNAKKVDAPLVEKYADDLKFGILGFVIPAASDNVNMDDFSDQLKLVTDKMGEEAN